MIIDLGEIQKASVKIGASTYEVGVPNLEQSQNFRDKMKGQEGKELEVFVELMDELGLPSEVSKKLSVAQLGKLSEGLLGTPGKK
jgi:hypothetical protein